MEQVTPEQCQQVVRETGMKWLGHHKCGGCRSMVGYEFHRDGNDVTVAFDPRCDCNSLGYLEPCTWEAFANGFNMQTPEVRAEMWERFKAGKATHETD